MNVLLVDDDRFVVAALQKNMDWDSLSISGVLTAYTAAQAQKILETQEVDICVCDIEMPGESGLDLLDWVRNCHMQTQFIFLTSFAEFRYAQKAITLNSSDYQLKPIDYDKLYSILKRVADHVKKNAAYDQIQADSEHWKDNYHNIIHLFWKNLFQDPLLSKPEFFEIEMKKKALPYSRNDVFLPVLLHLCPTADAPYTSISPTLDFCFQNIAAETLQSCCILYEALVAVRPLEYILIIHNMCLQYVRDPLENAFAQLFNNLRKYLKCDVFCCISNETTVEGLPGTVKQMHSMWQQNLTRMNTPLLLTDYTPKESSCLPPSLDVIDTFLTRRQADAAIQNIRTYLQSQTDVNRDMLLHLRLDIEQLVFSYLSREGIEAHTLFAEKETGLLSARALDAPSYMMDYLSHIITRGVEYSKFIQEEDSVTDIILNYIHQHYSEDITRTMLADLVYLNPDYMARLFKKQMHVSIVNYITDYRMKKAMEFLQDSDLPVNVAASKVGYGNYSYFSKLFKDTVGCTPNEYRKRYKR